MSEKLRLDALVAQTFPDLSRTHIQSIIKQGQVSVDGKVITKPGSKVEPDAQLVLQDSEQKFVSRAGYKLEKALELFDIDVAGLVALDAGLSTGGFADCLLQRGIAKVYGIDVGTDQVHEKLKSDKRLVIMEQTNVRTLATLPERVDLVTLDLSFISVLKVMQAVSHFAKPHAQLIMLIKPQFEVERSDISRGDVVKDDKMHDKVIANITDGMREFGFELVECIESPLLGASGGNKEFLAYFRR